jgi:hypothetical protein
MNELPEAPVSVNTRVKSTKGFEYQVTIRGDNFEDLMNKIVSIEDKFLLKQWTPLTQNPYQKKESKPIEYVDGRVCPKDGAKIIIGSGKIKEKCVNYKFDMATKKSVGSCDYLVWN